jgi:hypothetical protein
LTGTELADDRLSVSINTTNPRNNLRSIGEVDTSALTLNPSPVERGTLRFDSFFLGGMLAVRRVEIRAYLCGVGVLGICI